MRVRVRGGRESQGPEGSWDGRKEFRLFPTYRYQLATISLLRLKKYVI